MPAKITATAASGGGMSAPEAAGYTVAPARPRDPGPLALLQASQALMRRLYKPEENNFLQIEELEGPDIRFFAAHDAAGTPLGCCALQVKAGYGEVKSLFTAEEARGRGVALALLQRVEEAARAEGLPLLRLETGEALEAACRLYERQGFTRCGVFGSYADNGVSVFMEKRLPA